MAIGLHTTETERDTDTDIQTMTETKKHTQTMNIASNQNSIRSELLFSFTSNFGLSRFDVQDAYLISVPPDFIGISHQTCAQSPPVAKILTQDDAKLLVREAVAMQFVLGRGQTVDFLVFF